MLSQIILAMIHRSWPGFLLQFQGFRLVMSIIRAAWLLAVLSFFSEARAGLWEKKLIYMHVSKFRVF